MSLSCSCSEWDGEGYCYVPPDDFTTFKGKRRKRCCSCKDLIDIGALCLEFEHFRYPDPDNEVESRIYSEDHEIYKSPSFMCEKCGDQYFNLTELGFCVAPYENVFDLLEEYKEMQKEKRIEDALADYAHKAWSKWMKYIFSKSKLNEDGTVIIPKDLIDRWTRQTRTEYKDLPKEEQTSDQNQASEILSVIFFAKLEGEMA